MAQDLEHVSNFKMEMPFATDRLAVLIDACGADILGPFDGEGAATLLADLDAGWTGAMTSALLSAQWGLQGRCGRGARCSICVPRGKTRSRSLVNWTE